MYALFLQSYISDELLSLQSNNSDEHCQHMKKCFELAQSCIDTDQHKRPAITEVLCKLYEIESQIEKVISVGETSIDQVGPYLLAHGLYIGTSLCGLWCIFHAMSDQCVHLKFSLIVLLITV